MSFRVIQVLELKIPESVKLENEAFVDGEICDAKWWWLEFKSCSTSAVCEVEIWEANLGAHVLQAFAFTY